MSVKVQNGKIVEQGPRPQWSYPTNHPDFPGELITDDAVYRAGGLDSSSDTAGWFEVVDENKPTHDPVAENPPKPKPQSDWLIEPDRVVRTWNAPEPKPVQQRKAELREEAEDKHEAVLREGFADSDGVRWQATLAAQSIVLNLTQRIQEYRAGTMSTELPKGKAKARLRDAAGQIVEATPAKVIALAEQGDDFKEDADDRYEELVGQIMAAASHDDLNAVDVTTGWPS